MSTKQAPEPMGGGQTQETNATKVPESRQRNAYALTTLIGEVQKLFPETKSQVGGYDGRNTALEVTFKHKDKDEFADLAILLPLVKVDHRVAEVIVTEDKDEVLVQLHSNPRIQDLRDTFFLADAWIVLVASEDESQ